MRDSVRAFTAVLAVAPTLLLLSPVTSAIAAPGIGQPATTSHELQPIPDVPQIIPVMTCAKARGCGAGFTVTLTDATGVKRTETTGRGAGAMFRAEGLTAPIQVEVRTPRLAMREATLRGEISDDLSRGTGVDLVSTVGAGISAETGISTEAALVKAKIGMGVDPDLTFSQRLAGVGDFSPGSFLARARKRGGVDRYISEIVVPKILAGARFDFSGTRGSKTTRSGIQLTDSVLNAAGVDSDLSGFLGLPDPAKEISEAMDQLVSAITEGFSTLGAMITALMREEQETQYQIYVNTLANLTSATVAQVEQLQFMSNMDLSTAADLETYAYYQQQVYNVIVSDVDAEYYLYEPTLLNNIVAGSEGLLQAGHDMAQVTQKYYVAEDVTNLQGLVEYWATMAAVSNLLIVNAMTLDPSIPSASLVTVQLNQNNTAETLNDNAMLAMPDSLSADEIGSWEANEAYTIVGAKNVAYKTITQMAKWGNADCGSFKATGSGGVGSLTYVSQDTIQGWWQSMADSDVVDGSPVYSLATGAQASAVLETSRYDSSAAESVTALAFLQAVASQESTVPRAAVTSDTVHILGRQDADKPEGGYKGAKLCTAIDMNSGGTGINVEVKYDKKNSIDTTAFASRPVQLAPNWAALR